MVVKCNLVGDFFTGFFYYFFLPVLARVASELKK